MQKLFSIKALVAYGVLAVLVILSAGAYFIVDNQRAQADAAAAQAVQAKRQADEAKRQADAARDAREAEEQREAAAEAEEAIREVAMEAAVGDAQDDIKKELRKEGFTNVKVGCSKTGDTTLECHARGNGEWGPDEAMFEVDVDPDTGSFTWQATDN